MDLKELKKKVETFSTILDWSNFVTNVNESEPTGPCAHKICAMCFVVEGLPLTKISPDTVDVEVYFGVDWHYAKENLNIETDTDLEKFTETQYTSDDAEELFLKAVADKKVIFSKIY